MSGAQSFSCVCWISELTSRYWYMSSRCGWLGLVFDARVSLVALDPVLLQLLDGLSLLFRSVRHVIERHLVQSIFSNAASGSAISLKSIASRALTSFAYIWSKLSSGTYTPRPLRRFDSASRPRNLCWIRISEVSDVQLYTKLTPDILVAYLQTILLRLLEHCSFLPP